jgi:exocyst complex component 7
MGEEAGELDSFVRFLVMRLLNSLKGKALNYTKDGRDDGQARSNLFMLNNSFYLLEELGPSSKELPVAEEINTEEKAAEDRELYRIDNSWFVDKINKLMDSEKVRVLRALSILAAVLLGLSPWHALTHRRPSTLGSGRPSTRT